MAVDERNTCNIFVDDTVFDPSQYVGKILQIGTEKRKIVAYDGVTRTATMEDIHPWVGDLRNLSRMLAGEIEIPHLIVNHSSFPNPITGERKAYAFPSKACLICAEAFGMKVRYQESLLLKENHDR
jgi:hypothetical protein